jgi:hypothetical protein
VVSIPSQTTSAEYERQARRMDALAAKAIPGSAMRNAFLTIAAGYRALAERPVSGPAAEAPDPY